MAYLIGSAVTRGILIRNGKEDRFALITKHTLAALTHTDLVLASSGQRNGMRPGGTNCYSVTQQTPREAGTKVQRSPKKSESSVTLHHGKPPSQHRKCLENIFNPGSIQTFGTHFGFQK